MRLEGLRLPTDAGRIPAAIFGSGVLLLAWSILEPAALLAASSPDVFKLRYVIGYVTIVPSCVLLMWGSRWLARSDLPAEHHRTVGTFVLFGGSAFLVFNVFLMFFFPTESVWIVTNWARWALSLGLCIALVVGISYTRGLSERVAAERHSLRAEHMEQQRDLVNQMNDILRHEVLNAAQIIHGNAALLKGEEEPIDPADERIERIYHQGEELTEVVGEVKGLLNTVEENRDLRPIQLDRVLRREVETLRTTYPEVDVETAITDNYVVEADELVGRVFGNILRNAVEHNDTDSLRIAVEVETTDAATVVTIRDDGEGIPERALDTLFERPQVGTHGLGLYLVRKLVDSYGGTVTLVETGADGTTFAISFPRPNSVAAGAADGKRSPADGERSTGDAERSTVDAERPPADADDD